jgi:hypothetical protein
VSLKLAAIILAIASANYPRLIQNVHAAAKYVKIHHCPRHGGP